jgi:exopolyphosphatase/pppGpp-phosphohydrolase
MKKKISLLIGLLLSFTILSFAQGKYGGIEIGGKGLKISVVDIKNIETGEFSITKFWTRNTAITRGISIDGKLRSEDVTETAVAVKEILEQLKSEYKLPNERIFIIASSGVAMASNKEDLAVKVKSLIGRDLEFVTSEQEGKLVTKGSVPPSKYTNSFIFDIGGGNSKGGFVSIDDANHYIFTPLAFDLGSVTLTEKIKKNASSSDFKDFVASAVEFNDTLKNIVKFMYDNKTAARRKKNVYMVGGTVWSFISLTRPGLTNAYEEFTFQDIKNYQYDLVNNFDKFEQQIDTQKDVAKVFDTYSREALLAGSYIMLNSIQDLSNPQEKKIYFVRQGHVAWLIAYIVDTVRKNK